MEISNISFKVNIFLHKQNFSGGGRGSHPRKSADVRRQSGNMMASSSSHQELGPSSSGLIRKHNYEIDSNLSDAPKIKRNLKSTSFQVHFSAEKIFVIISNIFLIGSGRDNSDRFQDKIYKAPETHR